MKKTLFIDRDGTILAEPANGFAASLEEFSFLQGVITALSKIVRETDYELVMYTIQDGPGTDIFQEEMFWPTHNKMLQILKNEGVIFAEVFIDRSRTEDNSSSGEAGIAIPAGYLARGIDLESSYVIGDRVSDLELARELGCLAIFFSGKPDPLAVYNTTDWNDIYNFLRSKPRLASLSRKTKETSIELQLNLDGSGKCNISTGIGFFDHMLEQIPRHGGFDISLRAEGDLNVDQHHTIEDVAIVLGEGFSAALGSKKGIERYGFLLPMDDSLARTAIDFGGRPWLIWDVPLSGPTVGGVPSEMFFHFFKSFSDSAKCNLNIRADGDNDHHKVEAVFKSFARAVKSAVSRTGKHDLPSTKGTL